MIKSIHKVENYIESNPDKNSLKVTKMWCDCVKTCVIISCCSMIITATASGPWVVLAMVVYAVGFRKA